MLKKPAPNKERAFSLMVANILLTTKKHSFAKESFKIFPKLLSSIEQAQNQQEKVNEIQIES